MKSNHPLLLKPLSFYTLLVQLFKNQKSTLYFLGASFGGSVFSFFLLPLFTKYLSVEDFGVIGFALALNTFMAPLFSLCFNSFYIKAYNEQGVNGKPPQNLLSTIFLFSLGWAFVFLFVLILVVPVGFRLLGINIPFYPPVLLVLFTGALQIPFVYYLLELRLERKARSYFWVSIIQSVACLAIPLLFVIYYKPTANSRLLGYALAFFLVSVYCVIRLKNKIRLSFDKALLRKAFAFSSPLILYSLAYLSFDFIDRYFVDHFNKDLKILGFYNVGFQFANLVFVFSIAIYRAYEPNYYQLYYSENYNRLNRLFDYTNYVIWAVGIVVLLSLPLVVDLFTAKDYSLSVEMGRWLVLSAILQAVNMVYQTYYAIASKTFSLMVVSLFMLLVYVVCGYFLSEKYHYMGTIYAKIAIQLLILISSYFIFYQKLKASKSFLVSLILSVFLLLILFVYE